MVASEPACGSVRAKQPSRAPLANGTRKRRFCSSVPCLCTGSQKSELLTDMTTAWEAQALAISSTATA